MEGGGGWGEGNQNFKKKEMKTFKVIYLVFHAALSLLMYWAVILYS